MNIASVSTQDYKKEIKNAYIKWQAAENYFENVSDPDLIDFAIYDLQAAKKRYIYMLKRIRKNQG